MAAGTYLNFDDAWPAGILGLTELDARAWGPRLRYLARAGDIDAFDQEVAAALPPFVLYGSGDFHHLAAVLLRRVSEPVTVVSFDNHPDWDVRPPRWACGGWVNRALELPTVRHISIWGCGNFELARPTWWFANRRAVRLGRIIIHPWAERQPPRVRKRFDCMTRDSWRARFERFAAALAGGAVYLTVDMDCLRADEAVANWENGLFTAADVAWAASHLRTTARLVGGDLCGPASPPTYARRFQRFAGWWDHPKNYAIPSPIARETNRTAAQTIWPALSGSNTD